MIVILLCSGGDPTARDKVRGSTVHRDMAPFSVAGDPERDGGRRTVACSVQCRPKRKIASVCCTGGVCCTYALVPYCCPLPTTRGICGRLDVCTCRHNWPITMGEYDLVNRKVTITHVFPNNDRLVCVSTAAGLSSAFDGRNGGRDSRSKKTNANMLVGDYIMEAKNLPPMEQVGAAMPKYVPWLWLRCSLCDRSSFCFLCLCPLATLRPIWWWCIHSTMRARRSCCSVPRCSF